MLQAYLRLLVFWNGLVILGVELSASRLLAPYFGSSVYVWASLIGLILLTLAIGYWFGGTWADRYPSLTALLFATGLAAFAVACIPVLAKPILTASLNGFAHFKLGLLLGSFFGVLLLLGLPMVLLGCVMPFALRLSLPSHVERAGTVSGQYFAFSTLGSFVGSFLPVVVLIPAWGTQRTYGFFSLSLWVVVLLGCMLARRSSDRNLRLFFGLTLCAGVSVGLVWGSNGPIKPGQGLVFETESPYQYIRVLEDRAGWRSLELNEGMVTHSKYHPRTLITGGEWDYFAVAPYFQPAPYEPKKNHLRWAIIGSGAGTSARLIHRFFEPAQLHGVEIDPDVVKVGEAFFDLQEVPMEVSVIDGRAWLLQNELKYDVITIDAYRQPYIPFELTTVEFFRLVQERLSPQGVVSINVARTSRDLRLVKALAATMRAVFPSIFVMDIHHLRNAHVVASQQKVELGDVRSNMNRALHPMLRFILDRARDRIRPFLGDEGPILTDDKAPVERLMDLLIMREFKIAFDSVDK